MSNWFYSTIRLSLQAGVTLLILLFLVACSESLTPFPPVLFLEETDDEAIRIYSVYPDGSNFDLVTEFDRSFLYWLSPDGEYIVLINRPKINSLNLASGTLQVVDIANNEVIRTIENVNHFATEMFDYSENVVWSHQSDKFLYLKESEGGEGVNLWLYDLKMDSIQQLTSGEALDHAPAWSRDDQQIAFVTLKTCGESPWNCAASPDRATELYWEIATIGIEGINPQVITNFKSSGLLEPDITLTMFCDLSWSPDKEHIAFENLCQVDQPLPTKKEVFVTKADGTKLWQLTSFSEDSTLPTYDKPLSFFSFHWTNESNLLIGFSIIPQELNYSEEGDFQGGILVMDSSFTTVNTREITNAGTGFAEWSPSGHYVIWFNERREDNLWKYFGTSIGELVSGEIVDLPISNELPVGIRCYQCVAVWSPDENYVAYVVAKKDGEAGSSGIAIASPTQELTVLIESQPGKELRPIAWIPVKAP